MSNSGDGSTVIQFGKFVGVMYPDVYFKFVTTLHNQHQDLVRAMTLAKVKLEDGSALDFLNLMLGTKVTIETPMEIGYSQLLDALNSRIITQDNIDKAAELASHAFREHQMFPHLPEEDIKDGGGLFKPIEELEEEIKKRDYRK